MVELVDTASSKGVAERRVGSNPTLATTSRQRSAYGSVLELVDSGGSDPSARKGVRVRVSPGSLKSVKTLTHNRIKTD